MIGEVPVFFFSPITSSISHARADGSCSKDHLRIERYEPLTADRILQSHGNDVPAAQTHHASKFLLRGGLQSHRAKFCGKNSIIRGWAAASLEVAEDGHTRLDA